MTKETEVERVIAKLKSLETERAPSTILDKGDALILLGYIQNLEGWLEDYLDDPS